MRKLYTTLLACLCAAATAFAAENVYTLKLVTMMQAVAGEYQQEITFDQANTTYTFVDFLGSGCNFTVKIEPQEGVSLDDISKYKYIKPDDGTTAITIFGPRVVFEFLSCCLNEHCEFQYAVIVFVWIVSIGVAIHQ